ncbi:16S rRNA (adenine(1518)-N(6)/adenine(1519)-N(6))-dimethyltransferase RsmA [Promethearchaeum syntrophicum]|uniref:16S rRNA (Adenine(1518)-N(6)/adenine(1519)-N(6))-dimethyltransferase RsmA n=1 Tax=Promethearchaeum syntrophicum TaxID=2594042 RepID=A0A5B9D8W1_9ARCH|nr:16S rRNA (adenine(1518)-N(6)/adenine(1519)-N(6))-dimethyltransferase RsmA [Candidatus Prometheoarchaeum syntrophicum]QEE15066.1 putative ribosomal RNA small subunit methyltransferase A [Candidatus Prometheoarchaeum syntrophicum]
MPFYSKRQLLDKLSELNIRLDKNRGQCYLIDENIANFILKEVDIDKYEDIILEIGSGLGTLSNSLIKRGKKVYLIDNDEKITNFLYNNLKAEYKVELIKFTSDPIDFKQYTELDAIIINGDAIKIPFPGVTKIVGNIPYQISAPLIFKIIDSWTIDKLKNCILMVQDEFANRLVAKVNSKNYSRISAAVGLYLNIKKIKTVPPSCFFPKPRVTSVVIELTAKNSLSSDSPENLYRKDYLSFLRGIFPFKNKSLRNAISFFLKNDENAAIQFKYFKKIIKIPESFPFINKKLRRFSPQQLFNLMRYGTTGKNEILQEFELDGS